MYLWRRIGSFVIDSSIISMLSQIVFSLIGSYFTLTLTNIYIDLFKIFIALLIVVCISTAYNIICYMYFKFPLGKLLLKIQVLDEHKQRISNFQYLIREFTKYTYVYATLGLYLIYQLIRYDRKHLQTFHDRRVNTHIYM